MFYAMLAIGVLAVGVTQVEIAAGWTWQNIFAALWMLLALLTAAAHLQRMLQSDEQEKQLARIKREKYAALERKWQKG
jgi:membrane protein implicated in regulation of membrane protease activity